MGCKQKHKKCYPTPNILFTLTSSRQNKGKKLSHHIEAITTKGSIKEELTKPFDIPVFLQDGFSIVALYPAHIDYWCKKLDIKYDSKSVIFSDCSVTHYFAKKLGLHEYAIIMTEYFGGIGEQYASVYRENQLIMPETEGGINKALKLIGVVKKNGKDEFDTIQLNKYRSFDSYFENYN